MGFLDYAGLQYLWDKLKEKFAPKSHNHDDRYYTETEMDAKLNRKAESIVLANDANLNNVTTPGFYSCGGGNSIANKPSGTDAIGLIVTHNASGAYYTQILTTSSNANTYRRTCLNGTWSKWTQDKYTDTNTWRGIQNNLTSDSTTDSLSAAQGKVLKTLVDGKAASGHKHTKDQVGLSNVDNTADNDKAVASAAKLTTARTVSGGSDITLDFKYDGSGNSTANIGFYNCNHIVQNTNNYPFHRFAKLDANKEAWSDKSMTFLINQDYSGGGYGICRLVYRSNADSSSASVSAEWLVRKGLSANSVQVAIKTDKTNGAYCDAFYKSGSLHMGCSIRALASGGRASQSRTWTLIGSIEASGTTTSDKKNSSECWKTIADAGNELHKQAYSASAPAIDRGYVASSGSANSAGSCTGNSASASKLTSSAGSATQPVYFKDGKPVAGTYTLGDASSKMVRTLGTVGNTSWANKTTDDKYVPTMSFMAYWNGAYGGTSSNLQYCDRGRFGTIVTKNSGDFAVTDHTHDSIKDAGDSRTLTFAYSKDGMKYEDYLWLAGWNGGELRVVDKSQFAIVGHTHSYLPLAGGTMSGQIKRDVGCQWIYDRDNCIVYGTSSGTDSEYHPVIGQKTPSGAWTLGTYSDEKLIFNYTTDADKNAGKNNGTQVCLPAQAGTIITSATIGSQSVNYATSAGSVNGVTLEWSGTVDLNSSFWLAAWSSDGKKIKAMSTDTFAVTDHTHDSIKDAGDSRTLTFAYSKDGMKYEDYLWLAGWNGGELRVVDKSQFATASAGVTASGSNYVRFGNGTQICWGITNCKSKETTASFSVAFNNTSYAVTIMGNYGSWADTYWITGSHTTTSFAIKASGGSAGDRPINWIAIGTWK